MLPGVGAFSAAADSLDQMGLREPIADRIHADKPMLCICLGMQLLAESSEEAPGITGLGVIPSCIKRFSDKVKVPQLGWNEVIPTSNGPFATGEAYFANSFRLTERPDGWGCAETDYGGTFISSVWRGRLLACQFHPELSGTWGQQLLSNWIEGRTC